MKKVVFIIFLVPLFITLVGCQFIEENRAKNITKGYYQALVNSDYEEAFDYLYLYDVAEDHSPTDGTVLSESVAKQHYMDKVHYLEEQGYQVKDFEIEDIRYEDGHTFFLELSLFVEHGGETFEWAETVDIWDGEVWVIEKDDPFAIYRDGRLNIDFDE
ncbi:hypothetical protein [Alkalibacillus aidingensis]|uniref:hypothetical protein n=1 Tax=Alkalibacillus aidingensis TaxID=2747607 RepID=UPI001661015F|nr:hypothetical protein [Alkalibacillus aidingensis]